jgi:hypothetical protein
MLSKFPRHAYLQSSAEETPFLSPVCKSAKKPLFHPFYCDEIEKHQTCQDRIK